MPLVATRDWRDRATAYRSASLVSVARSLPDRCVGNDPVAERAGVTADWIAARTGVRERRFASADERLTDFAVAAGRDALELAGIAASQVDAVFVATMAADAALPNAAPVVACELGATGAAATDVGAACTGFLSALSLAASQVEAGRIDHALVIGADVCSRLIDHGDRNTASMFADGAGAVVVASAGEDAGAIGPIRLHSEASEAITMSHAEHVIHMNGHDTFRQAVRRLAEGSLEAIAVAGVELEDVDVFVYHQANGRILEAVADRLGLETDRVVNCIERFGNTSSATLPIALTEAERDGLLEPGSIVLLAAFGAGFTWGAGVLEWG